MGSRTILDEHASHNGRWRRCHKTNYDTGSPGSNRESADTTLTKIRKTIKEAPKKEKSELRKDYRRKLLLGSKSKRLKCQHKSRSYVKISKN
jgi:hypothetical protein